MRANRRKKPPLMTPGKWALLAALLIALLLIGLNSYYRWIQSPVWQEERAAEAKAAALGTLAEADDSYKYTWDKSVWIVKGKDLDGDDAYVWLESGDGNGQPLTIKAKDGESSSEIKSRFLQAKPDAAIKHIKLGMLEGVPVWELFYSRKEASTVKLYYDFYRFRDGTFIVTYKLPSR